MSDGRHHDLAFTDDVEQGNVARGTEWDAPVRCLASFLQCSRDTATAEDLRRFQLHPVDRDVSPITLNATITGQKFFFHVTLNRGEPVERMRAPRRATLR